MKKALLALGGITYKNYAIGDLMKFPQVGEYQLIKELDCEQFLDNKVINFFSKLWLVGIPFREWDRFSDYFKIIGNKKVMQNCSDYLFGEVFRASKEYDQIDLISHSLGTLITLASPIKVNNIFLLGSPLTSKSWAIRRTANNFIKEHGIKCQYQYLSYLFSANDIVCSKPNKYFSNNICCTPSSHAFTEYIDTMLKHGLIKL